MTSTKNSLGPKGGKLRKRAGGGRDTSFSLETLSGTFFPSSFTQGTKPAKRGSGRKGKKY